ncbi:MAG: arginine--tRNA ligase [Bacteroidetes bacterium]|nr:MAG: arginine--tRNA ligase [Bacteroidota bacterium]MBL1145033.1 arginine--tRNA ligase [Bacteroidota bacterium]NOG57830.1 arginine--tRNA ligase [Bacteroidota bacterium]
MNPLESKLIGELQTILPQIFNQEIDSGQIQIQQTRKDFVGDLTLVVFPLTKISRKSPEQTANEIGDELLSKLDWITNYNVVKGFLNLVVSKKYWLNFFRDNYLNNKFGFAAKASGKKMMVEYSSPNTNKPLHLGHLRNNFLGYSVAEILKANGHEVYKVQIINDRGIHICKSMLAWLKFGNSETPESSGLKGDHLVGKYYVEFDKQYKAEISTLLDSGMEEEEAKKKAPLMLEAQEMLQKWEAGDEEVRALWQKMNTWVYDGFKLTYETMGVDFDKLYYESNTYIQGKEKVLDYKNAEDFYQKEDGSIWINLEKDKLDNKLLLRSDGTSVYMTQDIGTAIIRHEEFACQNYLYVVGNEQDYHFKVLAIILKRMGMQWADGIEHLSYGMVDLPSGKMKSREGTVVDADDLMEQMENTAEEISKELGKLNDMPVAEQKELFHNIGLGALKYFILKVDPKKRMLFDPKESIDFNGNTGPFIQYAHARIQSILTKNNAGGSFENLSIEKIEDLDLQVVKKLHEYPQIIFEAGANKSPAVIANYIYDLVKEFNHFYQNSPAIIKEEDVELKSFRLALCELTGNVIKSGMGLLGINVPNRM